MLEELKSIPPCSRILLLGDIVDPTQEGLLQGRELFNRFQDQRHDVRFVPGNNDWWATRTGQKHHLWETYQPKSWPLAKWLHTFEGGNYQNLPWAHHHDTISLEEEQKWSTLLALDAREDATVLASHFPFVYQDKNLGLSAMMSWWDAALEKTNIQTLVFGHLHEEYLDQIPDEYKGRKIQVVSDHRERLLHEVIQ